MSEVSRLTRHQILLYSGDFERLSEIYSEKRPTQIIRILVRRHIEQVEEKLREAQEKIHG